MLHLVLRECLFPAAHCLSLLERGRIGELLGRSSLLSDAECDESASDSLPITMAAGSGGAPVDVVFEPEVALQQLLGPNAPQTHAGSVNLSVLPRCRSSLARHVALELVLALCSGAAPGAAHNLQLALDELLELHHARIAPDLPPAPVPDHPEQLAPIRLSDWEVRTVHWIFA